MVQIRAPLSCWPLGKLQKHHNLVLHLWNEQSNRTCFIHPLHHRELMNESVLLQNCLKLVEILFQLLMFLHCLPGSSFSCFFFLSSKYANAYNHVHNINCVWPRVKRWMTEWVNAFCLLSPWCYDAVCLWVKL